MVKYVNFRGMRRVSVAELKAKLSEYLGYAKAGEDVIVTDRGKPVARLTALAEEITADEHFKELVRTGVMRPGKGKLPKRFWEMPRPADPDSLILKALLEEREEGR